MTEPYPRSTTPPAATTPQQDDDIDLSTLFASVWAARGAMLKGAAAALVLAAVMLLFSTPSYRATALLQLEERSNQLMLPTDMADLLETSPRAATEIEIVGSRRILGQAVAALHLDWSARPMRLPLVGGVLARTGLGLPQIGFLTRYDTGDAGIALTQLAVPPDWVGLELTAIRTGPESFRLTDPEGRVHDGRVGVPLRLSEKGFTIEIGRLDGEIGRGFRIVQVSVSDMVRRLRGMLGVSEKGRDTGILQLSLVSDDRRRAARVLDAVTEAYVRQNIDRNAAEAASSLDFIREQLPEAVERVRQAELKLNRFREQAQAIDLTAEAQGLLEQLRVLDAELRQLDTKEDELQRRFTPNHPEYRNLLNERARAEQRRKRLEDEVGALPETQREVLNLTQELELAREIYTQLRVREQEVAVLRASAVGNVRVIDSAETAPDPVSPRVGLTLLVGLVLGAVAALAWRLLAQAIRRGIRAPEEIEALGLPVFATVPLVSDMPRQRPGTPPPILARDMPRGLAAEAFRSLRTALRFGLIDAERRSIAITGPTPDAGKSFVSLNLAMVMAQADQSVCLIDADMRRGELARRLGLPDGLPGLSDYLAGDTELDAVLRPAPVGGLSLIPTGIYPPNPSEMMMRPRFAEMIEMLGRRFDCVIVDCPPILVVTDAVIVARAVGATVLVARHGSTAPGEMAAAMRALDGAGRPAHAAVLNGFERRHARPGREEGYYGYGYGYGYSYEAPIQRD
ncbi:tyrosine-protein kinase Etk/Wzc [Rhodovulum sulfidophilum]|uniref:polysaccharide biosynthesis tyrosine autokinase n=1 Tax=Rhodovulum sulfidophilum TaxID=35806 RepID=UPI0005A70E31|nr:polysaccharide biosynthesis tyrosine autokinase [Rhodovulum sulfidophilum]ANB35207.1 hypothetical protein A6W98_14705 [Rhodovulum sulfidophilum DSM 1374]ANB39029.1 hypothetical protein A6024_14570 [Rhodovulum sulfidophilum]MCW2303972.1 tyrosine-protein kinase Etk/Wzc [Rhodovulum sulfidophilum]